MFRRSLLPLSSESMYCLFFVVLCIFVCICVLYYCRRVATQLRLTNISYHVKSQQSRTQWTAYTWKMEAAYSSEISVTIPKTRKFHRELNDFFIALETFYLYVGSKCVYETRVLVLALCAC
jgi:hypothetical protein